MQVRKRDGELEEVSFDKILKRITQQTYGLNLKYVEPVEVSKKVIDGLMEGITTKELDNLAAETAAMLATNHPDYSILASRIIISNLYKETLDSFTDTIIHIHTNTKRLSQELYDISVANRDLIDSKINNERDSIFDYFGFKTLERSYLIKVGDRIAERPQYMWMRVALGIWGSNLEEAFKTYDLMSQGYFTHATPTLFNAGTPRPQMSSCFLIANKGDSLEGIMETCTDVAKISSLAGGIGLHLHDIRANGSHIHKSGGTSKGLLPLLKTYNELAKYWDQCFEKNTKVELDFGLLSIKDIKEGMFVRTSDGQYKKVLQVNKFRKKEFIQLEVGNVKRKVTENHCFLIIRGESETPQDILKDKIKRGIVQIEWLEVGKILASDLILKYKYNNEGYYKRCVTCDSVKESELYHKDKGRNDGYCDRCIECASKYVKKVYDKLYKPRLAKYNSEYRKNNIIDCKNRENKYLSLRLKDPNSQEKLKRNYRSRIHVVLKAQNQVKDLLTVEYLGCTIKELKQHLEFQFTEGMTWNNYGEWHVDHKLPCSKFDLTKEEEVFECFHYTNLQPLWAIDNIRKSNLILPQYAK